jgi:dTDP-4-dehydrorhamnose 3,5-epimerase
MVFKETRLKGAFIIELEKIIDSRGFFSRAWCQKEFEANGLNPNVVQCNLSFNTSKGTLRGMHYQIAPHEEAKIVRCIRGKVYDVIIDLRPKSPTYLQWIGVELSSENRKMLYVPENFAHGYLTLADNTELFYQVSHFYSPESESGIRWNDVTVNIKWPQTNGLIITDKDKNWPDFPA